ncbi:MAG: LamG-like jellyroll fold domain-containing protein, partial [Planctomycetota bacterium]
MYKRLIYLASMVNVSDLDVCKTHSIRSARKVSLFRDFVLAVFLSFACSLLTAMPVAYGAEGYALEVGGGNTVTIDDNKDALRLGSYTYEFWMKDLEGPTGSWRNVFTKGTTNSSSGRGPLLALRPSENGVHFDHSTGSGQSTLDTHAGIPVNGWTHIALVLTSLTGDQIIYQDGVEMARRTSAGLTDATQDPVLNMGLGANVLLDDFRVWNYARTPEEIQADMNRELSGDEEGLVGYWRFNEGEGTTAHDVSPYENHGIIVSASWTTDVAPVTPFLSPGVAYGPAPADGVVDVPPDVVLSWKPGEFAPALNGHIVYLSESFSDVNDGIGGITQSASSYAPPQRLDFETTYYWRVDEVNAPPDSTVYPGEVWSFATEPVGYPVDGANVTATASSTGGAGFGPEKTIDGSGLDADDLHSTAATDMWLSDNEPLGAWIQYEFDKVHKLHEMWAWNSNQIFEGLFGFGLKDVTVEYSTNGADWTALAGVPQFAQAPGTAGYAHDTTVDFGGVAAQYVRLTATSNWGGVLPQYSLSEVRFFSIPVTAREPSPDSGATDVDLDAPLSWRAGRDAATHSVSVSTDEQAVIDGTAPVVSVTDASYSSTLDLGNTYFWRIDEVNDAETPTIWQGDIWSFSTPGYLVVDDFEDYNDYPPDEIYTTWLDGYQNPANGSQVGYLSPPTIETGIVHGGAQSMPLLYSNTGGATYSEAARTFAAPQDWTKYGIQTLVLYFHGTPGNTGQLYVKVNGVKVAYPGDAADIADIRWKQWNIDLASLGVNLASITTLALGIDGNGAGGTLYVDDIRLYRLAPEVVVPSEEIWIEAEAGTITAPMQTYDDPVASGGKYIGTENGI